MYRFVDFRAIQVTCFLVTMSMACGGCEGAPIRPDAGSPVDAAADVDAAIPADAHVLPGSKLEISSSGDDANDGVTQPVRTLRHAIVVAVAHPEITSISMAAGSYGAETGEVFPYTVPPNVTVFGPADGPANGFAILVGSGTETGLLLGAGTLRSLTLENFAVAIVARGEGELENVRVGSSRIAVHEETTARLTVSGLDINGASGACATGIDLIGDAVLTATDLTTRQLGTSLEVSDHGTATVSRASVIGDGACAANAIAVRSSGTFALTDSVVVGGFGGAELSGTNAGAPVHASLTNVIVRNMRTRGLGGRDAMVQMTGGELSNNASAGLSVRGGTWSLIDVAIIDNPADGATIGGMEDQEPATLTMRGCTVTGNLQGVSVSDFAVLDLGTVDSPGNNILQLNRGVGVLLSGEDSQREFSVVGNTWQPFVQGADKTGRYAATVVPGPVAFVNGNNFSIRTATRRLRF